MHRERGHWERICRYGRGGVCVHRERMCVNGRGGVYMGRGRMKGWCVHGVCMDIEGEGVYMEWVKCVVTGRGYVYMDGVECACMGRGRTCVYRRGGVCMHGEREDVCI